MRVGGDAMRSPLLLLAGLLVVVLCTALVAPFFIDWSQYRGQIEAYARQLTGRHVELAGDIDIRLLPTPNVHLTMLRIGGGSQDDGGGAPLLDAENVAVEIALNPLLKGQIEITSVILDNPVFVLEHTGGGEGNWSIEPSGDIPALFGADNIALNRAVIRNGVVHLRDTTRAGNASLENVELEISAPSLAGPYRVRGSMEHEDVPIAISVATGKRRDTAELPLSIKLVQQDGSGPTYSFDGYQKNDETGPHVDGLLTVQAGKPETPEDAAAAETHLPYVLVARLVGTLAQFKLDNISLLLDEDDAATEVTGAVEAALGDVMSLSVRLAAGHLDFDRLAATRGLGAGDLVPDLALVDDLTGLVALLPLDLDARLSFRAAALTIAGETADTLRFDSSFRDGVLRVDRLAGRLPGRGDLSVDDARYEIRDDGAAFVGGFALRSRDTRGLLRWAAPQLGNWLDAMPASLKGRSELSGTIRVEGSGIDLVDARFEQRDGTITGALGIDPGERPVVRADLRFDQLLVDKIIPTAAPAGEDVRGNLRQAAVYALEAFLPEMARAYDAQVKVSADRIAWSGYSGETFSLAATLDEGTLRLSELAVSGFNDVTISASGQLTWPEGHLRGALQSEIETPRTGALVELVASDIEMLAGGADTDGLAQRLSPAKIGAAVSLNGSGDGTRLSYELDADLGALQVSSSGYVEGDLETPENNRLDLEARISGRNDNDILAFAGIETVPGADSGEVRDLLLLQLGGPLREGATATAVLSVLDSRIAAEGVVQFADGAGKTSGEVTVDAESSDVLLGAFGFVSEDEDGFGPVHLAGTLLGQGLIFDVPSFGGRLGALDTGFNGTLDLSAPVPLATGNLTLSSVSLPGLLQHTLGVAPDAGGEWPATAFSTRAAAMMALDVVVFAGELELNEGITAYSVTGRVEALDGKVAVSAASMDLFGGRLTVDGEVERTGGPLRASARYALENAQAGDLAAGNGNDDAALLRGLVSLSGDVSGSGRSMRGLVSTLSGGGELTLTQAYLAGVAPQSLAEALGASTSVPELETTLASQLGSGEMSVPRLAGRYSIKDGVAQFVPLRFETDGADGIVEARFDLPAWTLRAQSWVGLTEHPDAPDLGIVYSGSMASPQRSFEFADLRSHFTVLALAEGMRQLEELQRQEEAQLARIEEFERRAREQARRRAFERAQSIVRAGAGVEIRPRAAPGVGGSLEGAEATASITPSQPEPAEAPAAAPEPQQPETLASAPTLEDGEVIRLPEPEPAPEPENEVVVIEIPQAVRPAEAPRIIVPAQPAQPPAESEPAEAPAQPSSTGGADVFSNNPNDILK